ncbi:MAG: tRNA dihydrouridine(20/20a) synthase DusA [Betaproteobacteria bacterium]|nr:tRNA dihydrouridine(20/20a) synthase DusA [Betaproteobacteria bacterium]
MQPAPAAIDRSLCVAPMMRYSHTHARHLWRLLCPPALLYTEMIPAAALAGTPAKRLLCDPRQQPVALQVGCREPGQFAHAAGCAEQLGYAEINLNCGCPSPRVAGGGFGACLMGEPQTVAACLAAAKDAVSIPVTVKCRIAIDDMDAQTGLDQFADCVLAAGCDALIVHARRAWLAGLNPKENRTRPPLDHDRVLRLKQRLGSFPVIINGGIDSQQQAADLIGRGVDGVMIGRAAVRRTLLLAEIAATRGCRIDVADAIASYLDYCAGQLAAGAAARMLFAPLMGVAACKQGARAFRQTVAKACANRADPKEVAVAAASLA